MNILITGCKRGIGLETALLLSKRGHKVYGGVKYQKQVYKLQKKYKDIKFIKLNINSLEDRNKALDLNLDVLINNAAIGESGSIAEIPVDLIKKNFDTNVFNTIELTQLLLKQMINKDHGKIIFIGSKAGTMPRIWMGAYSATKSTLKTMTTILRKEIKQVTNNIKIVLIEPGAYHTGFNQEIMETKYNWLTEDSYFKEIQGEIDKKENNYFDNFEHKKLCSITKKIVKAVESKNPRNCYSAPIEQTIVVWFYKIFCG